MNVEIDIIIASLVADATDTNTRNFLIFEQLKQFHNFKLKLQIVQIF